MDSNFKMPATSFVKSLSDESRPQTNEKAYTWFPTMNFSNVWPLDHCDLAAFNALLLSDGAWQTTPRLTIATNLYRIFATCEQLYPKFKEGPLKKIEVRDFFSLVYAHLSDHCLTHDYLEENGPRRLANLVGFFVEASRDYNPKEYVMDLDLVPLNEMIRRFTLTSSLPERTWYH
ncbi:uncharacterized protein F4812DRAFT_470960 [Daldinia caldariorum]|uniref:uncharacterized protein n=1 Tax=Daldinia caldariorum TaxID=326644 RepID=UPI00200818FA|nr:uncharacterized protein F4812DRAFT_470960 [Daldinia caldariorum]KAI1468366.1 hypothetical protein F4812DRAFT_470960 [Daldinia caldariorum]